MGAQLDKVWRPTRGTKPGARLASAFSPGRENPAPYKWQSRLTGGPAYQSTVTRHVIAELGRPPQVYRDMGTPILRSRWDRSTKGPVWWIASGYRGTERDASTRGPDPVGTVPPPRPPSRRPSTRRWKSPSVKNPNDCDYRLWRFRSRLNKGAGEVARLHRSDVRLGWRLSQLRPSRQVELHNRRCARQGARPKKEGRAPFVGSH